VLTIPLLYLLVDLGGLSYLIGNLCAIAASTLLRFTIAERVIWKVRPSAGGPVLVQARRQPSSP
jgi:putative flippase GtrA